MAVYGEGNYSLSVIWKQRDTKGKLQFDIYKYKDEATRDAKLKSFRSNSKVDQVEKRP